MRLKVRGDTFFLPSSDGSVYFRNNIGSFRMEGSSINQWIEKLMPVFNGEHSMHDLTDGLPEQYRKMVYEIAEDLYRNGFVRDVSRDLPHQLKEAVLEKYGSQIEFLDSFEGSGAHKFQRFRQSNVLAAGSGSFFVSLVKCLLEAGMPQIRMLITNPETTNRERILELAEHARRTDPEVRVDEVVQTKKGRIDWRSAVQSFDAVLFVSGEDGEPELRIMQEICREEKKVLLPAVLLKQVGLAGPLVHPDLKGDWESARRRIHQQAIYKDPRLHAVSAPAEAMLANVIVFEWFKTAAGVAGSELKNKLFLLDLETLDGSWHPFLPHPLANGRPSVNQVDHLKLLSAGEPEQRSLEGLMTYFSRLTSGETGIFHTWEEGDLRQLPLSQCRVQTADPLSEGPAELLPEIISNGINHEEARREAGLAGIEAYVSRMTGLLVNTVHAENDPAAPSSPLEFIGVGAGESAAEGISRGLQKCLTDVYETALEAHAPSVNPVQLKLVDDDRCRYYLSALTTIQGSPSIGFGEDDNGFPVAWVEASGCWYGAVDLNRTRALRRSLQRALLAAQNKEACGAANTISKSSVNVKEAMAESVSIPACNPFENREVLHSALQQLNRSRKHIVVYDLAVESFLKEGLAGAFGVSLREEEEG